MKFFIEDQKNRNHSVFLPVIFAAALSCGGPVSAQTNVVANSGGTTNVTDLGKVTVVGKLNEARSRISPDLGATAYTQTKEQIASSSQGDNAPFTQVILRSPGVAEDNAASGSLHVRGEHANLQYRIDDVLLPEGISGFGLELDPRFVESMQLVTGSLPAQYGFRTAGVVDIQTKSGGFQNGGTAEIYGGSYDTFRPSFEYSGSTTNFNYFVDGSYDHNALGIENPTASHNAIHDYTDQGKFFTYMSWLIDDTSRVSYIGSSSYSDFQIPNSPNVAPGNTPTAENPGAIPWWTQMPGQSATSFNSVDLNENQKEQNYYSVLNYQKSAGPLDYQVSALGRYSAVHFTPDGVGDLYFNGVSSDVNRRLYSGGLQADGSYELTENHTLRGGGMFIGEYVTDDSTTTVFPVDANGNPTGAAFPVVDNGNLHGFFTGAYLQDEWKIFEKLTLNFGSRFDVFNSSFDNECQLSPRANLIYQPTDSTTLHAGYSRYFTPPPVEDVSANTVVQFAGTSNASSSTNRINSVKAERANYYDAGISQKLAPGLTVGVDGYYKTARQQLDDGLFGQTLILSAFNYAKGEVHGVEFTSSYDLGGWSTYANVAYSVAQGENWDSAQFLFDQSDLNYVKNHWIYLDHDQTVSGSFGTSYLWKQSDRSHTRLYVDAIYGTGLRTDSTSSTGNNIPNGGTVPAYYTINMGAEQSWKTGRTQFLKARLDVVNITDNSYELRDGSGVGVNAASYGERLGFFGSLSYTF